MRLAMIALAALLLAPFTANADDPPRPIKLLIITGDNVGVHDWKATTQALRDTLSAQGRVNVEVTSTPADDLTDENLARYDVLLLNYRDTDQGGPKTKWSEANKEAFLKAVKGGKGLVVLHYASGSFVKPNWDEFEKAVAGGWRDPGVSRAGARVHGQDDRRQAPDLGGPAVGVQARQGRAVLELDDDPRQRRPGHRVCRPEAPQGHGQGRGDRLGQHVRQGGASSRT